MEKNKQIIWLFEIKVVPLQSAFKKESIKGRLAE